MDLPRFGFTSTKELEPPSKKQKIDKKERDKFQCGDVHLKSG